MKIIGINGSSRTNGNSFILLNIILDYLNAHDIYTEIINLYGLEINSCQACFACKGKKLCPTISDDFNSVFKNMLDSDGIILASPVYSADISAKMKLLLDRSAVVVATNPGIFKYKIGVSIAAVRRAGGMTAIDTMNHFFLNKEMIIIGSTYWNMVYGNKIGEVLHDDEGIRNMKNIAENILWFLKLKNNI